MGGGRRASAVMCPGGAAKAYNGSEWRAAPAVLARGAPSLQTRRPRSVAGCRMPVAIAPNRLSQISTVWTDLVRLHGGDRPGTAGDPRATAVALIGRYHEAVYSYLVAATRDPDRAAELFQEFALRFLRGDFRNLDPQRG